VCACECMCVCTYVSVYVCAYVCVRARELICVHIGVCVCNRMISNLIQLNSV
jgi:hypothetical protein